MDREASKSHTPINIYPMVGKILLDLSTPKIHEGVFLFVLVFVRELRPK
jgi:hypothetical protein